MDCKDCSRYNQETEQCADKKFNPRTYGAAIEIVNIFGVRAICTFCDHRERLVAVRMVCHETGRQPEGP